MPGEHVYKNAYETTHLIKNFTGNPSIFGYKYTVPGTSPKAVSGFCRSKITIGGITLITLL